MFGIPLAAIAGCFAASATLTALVAVIAAEYLNQTQEDHRQ